MNVLEKEVKYQISEKDFLILKAFLESKKCSKIQTIHENFYFDTNNYDLKKCGVSLRVRKAEKGVYTLTAKIKE